MLAKSEILSSKIENNDRLVLDQKAKCGEQFDWSILKSCTFELSCKNSAISFNRNFKWRWRCFAPETSALPLGA